MKEHLHHALRGFASALTAAALGVLSIALMLALYDIERTVLLAIAPLTALLLVQALVNEFLCEKNVSLLAYAFVNAALLLPGTQAVLARTVFIPGSGGFPVFLRMVILMSGFIGAYASQHLPGSNVFVRCGDALIIATAFYLGVVFMLGEAFHLPILAFALVTFLLTLLLTASLRAGGESESVIRGTGAGGLLVLLAVLFLCAVLAAALLDLADGHVSSLVGLLSILFSAVYRVGTVLLEWLGRLIVLFAGKPRAMNRAVTQQDSLVYQTGPMEEMGTAPAWVVNLIMGLLALLVAAGILAILYAMRSVRLNRARRPGRQRKVTRKSHLLAALSALLRRVFGVISFELAYRTHKRTPQGLFVLARRTGRIKRLPMRKSESAGAYLRRLHGVLCTRGQASTLNELADMLDRALYDGETIPLSAAQHASFAAQIRSVALAKKDEGAKDPTKTA